MSFAISLNTNGPVLPEPADRTDKPLPQPTSTQEIRQLAGSGENARQIAANLGLTPATVQTTIGYSISTDPQASTAQTAILVAGTLALNPPFDTNV